MRQRTILAAYFPTDIAGPSMWLFRGHLHDTLLLDLTQIAHEFNGSQVDICAALTD